MRHGPHPTPVVTTRIRVELVTTRIRVELVGTEGNYPSSTREGLLS
jgi:hypothetical protein